jgi:hypothetical protein
MSIKQLMEKRLNDEQETTEPTSCLCLECYNWRVVIYNQCGIKLGKFVSLFH